MAHYFHKILFLGATELRTIPWIYSSQQNWDIRVLSGVSILPPTKTGYMKGFMTRNRILFIEIYQSTTIWYLGDLAEDMIIPADCWRYKQSVERKYIYI